jgi:hypothetical protein
MISAVIRVNFIRNIDPNPVTNLIFEHSDWVAVPFEGADLKTVTVVQVRT